MPAPPSAWKSDHGRSSRFSMTSRAAHELSREHGEVAPELDVVGTYPAHRRPTSPNCCPNSTAAPPSVSSVTPSTASSPPTPRPSRRSAPNSPSTARTSSTSLRTSQNQCADETVLTYAFHHLQEYFTEDPAQMIHEEPFGGLFDLQRIGRYKPNAPVFSASTIRCPGRRPTSSAATGARWVPTFSSGRTSSRRSSTRRWSSTR